MEHPADTSQPHGKGGSPPPRISGEAGLRTLKNFLATAMMPVGNALYVYGGGWNRQDDGAGTPAVSIGVAPSWTDFFQAQDAGYSYRETGYYPCGGQNLCCDAGLDCSGYLGWTVYNTLHVQSSLPGYVQSAVGMAHDFARRGWGLWNNAPSDPLQPGDICSIAGHVWICIGACDDGSILLSHSTPSDSVLRYPGGGVQLSALCTAGETDCEAYRLATHYMCRFSPAWSARYAPVRKDFAVYTDFSVENAGRFRWALDGSGILRDPDSFFPLSAAQVLRALFGE